MSQNLKLQVLLSTVDKLTAPFQKATQKAQRLSRTLGESKGALRQLNSQFNQNEKQIKKYRDTLNPLKAQFNETSQKLEQARQKAKAMQRAFYDAKNPTAEFKRKLKEAQQAVSQLQQKKQVLIDRTRRVRLEFKQAGFDAKKMAEAQSELKRKMKSASDEIKLQEDRLKRLNQQMAEQGRYRKQVENLHSVSDKLRYMGQSAAIGGAAMTGSAYKLLSPALDFEEKFSKVYALTNLDKSDPEQAAQLNLLRDQAINLGATTSFTAAEVADGQSFLAMAGFKANEILAAMPAVLNMTKAAGIDMGLVSDIASDISSGFKILPKDMGRVGDVLTATFTKSNTTLELLGESMKYIGPVASTASQGFEQVSAMVGLLGNVGIKGSQAGTSLRSAMLRLAGPPKMAKEQLEELGISVENVNKGMKESKKAMKSLGISATTSSGKMKPMEQILKDVYEKTKNMSEVQRLDTLKKIFGVEAATAMAELVQQAGIGKLKEFENELKNAEGTAASVAQKMADNLRGELKNLESASQDIGIAIFNTISEPLKSFTQEISSVLRKMSEWIRANPELTASIAKWSIIIGGSLTILGLLSTLLSYLFYPVARLVLGFAKYTGILGIFNRVNSKAIKSLLSWKTGGSQVSGFLSSLGSRFVGLGRFVLGLLNPLNLVKNAFGLIKLIGSAVALVFSPLGLIIAGIAMAGGLIYKYWQPIKAFFEGFFEGFSQAAEPIKQAFSPLEPLFNAIGSAIQTVWKWITDLFTPAQQSSESLEKASNWGKKFGEWTANALNLALAPLTALIDGVSWLIDNIKNISLEGIGNKVGDIKNKFVAKAGALWDSTKALFSNDSEKPSSISSAVNSTAELAQKLAGQKWSGGYAGNGGKYEPKGIYHGGEYIMTKEATSRIGIANLNRLNYGKMAGLAALGSTVAVAQPMVQVDNRPPISTVSQPQAVGSVNQTVNITINAAQGQSEVDIARMVQRILAEEQRKAQAKQRSSLRDRG